MVALDTLYAMCLSWCLCRVCQRKEIKKRWIIVELSFNICHAATL